MSKARKRNFPVHKEFAKKGVQVEGEIFPTHLERLNVKHWRFDIKEGNLERAGAIRFGPFLFSLFIYLFFDFYGQF